jgi:hypothetical protein
MVDELQRGEGQHGASVALWLRQTINDPVFVDLFDPLKGERRACAVAMAAGQAPCAGEAVGEDPAFEIAAA